MCLHFLVYSPYVKSAVSNSLLFLLQIRQEKPYYIADPEVDSLVSASSYIFFKKLLKRKTEL